MRPAQAVQGYKIAWYDQYGARHLYNPDRPDMGRHVIMSSQTLDKIACGSGMSAQAIIANVLRVGGKCTRIDVAADIRNSKTTVGDFETEVANGRYSCRARSAATIKQLRQTGQTVYIGSRQSSAVMRVYDKAAEAGAGGDWLRVELEWKQKRAQIAANGIANTECLATYISSALRGFVDFPALPVWRTLGDAKLYLESGRERPQSASDVWLYELVAKHIARRIASGEQGTWGTLAESVIAYLPECHRDIVRLQSELEGQSDRWKHE